MYRIGRLAGLLCLVIVLTTSCQRVADRSGAIDHGSPGTTAVTTTSTSEAAQPAGTTGPSPGPETQVSPDPTSAPATDATEALPSEQADPEIATDVDAGIEELESMLDDLDAQLMQLTNALNEDEGDVNP